VGIENKKQQEIVFEFVWAMKGAKPPVKTS